MQRQSRSQVLPLFAEGIAEPREPLAPLAKRSVLAFNMRRADPLPVWVSVDVLLFPADALSGAVAPFAFGGLSVDLDVLRIGHAVSQSAVHSARIRRQAVSGQLKRLVGERGHGQLLHEPIRAVSVRLPNSNARTNLVWRSIPMNVQASPRYISSP